MEQKADECRQDGPALIVRQNPCDGGIMTDLTGSSTSMGRSRTRRASLGGLDGEWIEGAECMYRGTSRLYHWHEYRHIAYLDQDEHRMRWTGFIGMGTVGTNVSDGDNMDHLDVDMSYMGVQQDYTCDYRPSVHLQTPASGFENNPNRASPCPAPAPSAP
jgi:hypothetical protein